MIPENVEVADIHPEKPVTGIFGNPVYSRITVFHQRAGPVLMPAQVQLLFLLG
jgi:hypothetical protein